MSSPEHAGHGGSGKIGLFQKLDELIKRFLHQKIMREEIEKAAKLAEERLGHETPENREETERERQEKEGRRKYHKAKSAQLNEESIEASRDKRAAKVTDKLLKILARTTEAPSGASYLIEGIRRNPDTIEALQELMSDPNIVEIVNTLISEGIEVHGNSRELIKIAQRISYEAKENHKLAEIKPVLDVISIRVKELLWNELEISRKTARREGRQPPTNLFELLAEDPGIRMEDDEIQRLSEPKMNGDKIDQEGSRTKWEGVVDEMITTARVVKNHGAADWVKTSQPEPSEVVVSELVAPVDEIWGEIERREATGAKLSVDDLKGYERRLKEKLHSLYPTDVPPRSAAYDKAVQAIHAYGEKKLNTLARELAERLKTESPPIKEGAKTIDEFLLQMTRHKGRLGEVFAANPAMEKLFYGLDEESRHFRNKVFLKIHSAVLSDRRKSSNDNFGLYERADYTTFTDLLRAHLSKLRVKETGDQLGNAWADYYNNLSNAILQSRDIDFWASQPAADINNFNKSLGMFQNEYIAQAMSIPAVNAAFRAYEATLRSIMASNDGYIPPALIEYGAAGTEGFWDQQSLSMLRKMITQGAVPGVVRSEDTRFQVVDEDGHSVKIDYEKPLDISEFKDNEDELQMYMTLAKGMGLVSARYLEIFANAKVPGSDHPERGIDGFHSQAYEGVARAMNFFGMVVEKWKYGSYRYFYLMNLLMPQDKQIKNLRAEDSTEGVKMFMAYRDGTLKEKYGEEAKRFIDLLNFSGISSAIGKDTLWRQMDSTIGWSDRERERLGGPTRLALTDKYVVEGLKNLLVVNKYREEYRRELNKMNEDNPERRLATNGAGFDKLWKEFGEKKYKTQIDIEWEKWEGRDPQKGKVHTKQFEEYKKYKEFATKAFKARIWVEMAMRNPLVVAHNLNVQVPVVGVERGTKLRSLHSVLVQHILDIPLEDTKYGELYGKAGFASTPSQKQKKYMAAVLDLEGDLASVREFAINQGRDLTEADFGKIEDKTRRENALKYWDMVKNSLIGNSSAGNLYEQFGLAVGDNKQDYVWDVHKIEEIEKTLHRVKDSFSSDETITSEDGQNFNIPFLLDQAVNMSPEWILGTDDMDFGRMDMLNLGSRHWLRRGGDIAAHYEGGQKAAAYFTNLVGNPDKHELAKALKEVRQAYEGDTIEAGWAVVGNLADLTSRLYSLDLARLGSPAQLDVWRTRRNIAAWTANGRREFWDALEHADVLPPHAHFYHYGSIPEKVDIHFLRKQNHAANIDVWKEILFYGLLLAIVIQVWTALKDSAKDEDSGGGGGSKKPYKLKL